MNSKLLHYILAGLVFGLVLGGGLVVLENVGFGKSYAPARTFSLYQLFAVYLLVPILGSTAFYSRVWLKFTILGIGIGLIYGGFLDYFGFSYDSSAMVLASIVIGFFGLVIDIILRIVWVVKKHLNRGGKQ